MSSLESINNGIDWFQRITLTMRHHAETCRLSAERTARNMEEYAYISHGISPEDREYAGGLARELRKEVDDWAELVNELSDSSNAMRAAKKALNIER